MTEERIYPPYRRGWFRVSHGHRLYFELYGHPRGVPAVYLHGGPGAGFRESAKELFARSKYNVLLFDQRGAGRSRPLGATAHNTTDLLVADINRLLDFVGFDRALLVGGSWGSTLALVYAIRHPQRVSGLLLRGVFLANRRSMRSFCGQNAREFFPDVLERLLELVPPAHRRGALQYYARQMRHSSPRIRTRYATALAGYELSLLTLRPDSERVARAGRDRRTAVLGALEGHYLSRGCFLPENYILRNARRLAALPVTIVHGRYDFVCPPWQAFDLAAALPQSRLQIVTAGHSSQEPEIRSALRAELRRLAQRRPDSRR